MNLKIQNACGQCSDGAATMRKRVATQIKAINRKCLYTHCYAKSPQRDTKLEKIRSETKNDSRGVHELYPTWWTVHGEALTAMLNNHSELIDCGTGH